MLLLFLANAEASQLFEKDRREYNRRVRQVVEESWMDDCIDENGDGGDDDDDNNDNNDASANNDTIVNNATVFSSIDQSA